MLFTLHFAIAMFAESLGFSEMPAEVRMKRRA